MHDQYSVGALEIATQYVRRGWAIIPVPFREKAPKLKGWQRLRIAEAELTGHFGNAPSNIGLLLGEPNGWLVDVDLDTEPARRAAAALLPQGCTFGRESRRASHFLYRAPGTKTRKFTDPATKKMLVELRSTGQQTIVPGSVHPSGEAITWDRDSEPTDISSDELTRSAARIAAAALLAAHWPGEGSRNEAAMALAGALLRAGVSPKEAEKLIRAVALAAGDEEVAARVATVAATKRKMDAGEAVTGHPHLRELIAPAAVKKALEWLGLETAPQATTAMKAMPPDDPIGAVLAQGKLYRAQEVPFFVRDEGGEALALRSKRVEAFVARSCGLRGGKALKETIGALTDRAMTAGEAVRLEHLTAIGPEGEPLVHLGSGTVLRFAGGKYEPVPNGTAGILFDAERGLQALSLEKLKHAYRPRSPFFEAFRRVILDRLPPAGGHLTAVEQEALVLAGWISTFVRPWAPGRPILMLLGPPGCGKSVLQRLLAKLFFGPDGDTSGGTMLDRVMKDIAAAAVHRALVARDDVNDLPVGAIDVLCRLATGTVFEVANFHETLSLGSYRGRAQIVLSAFAPTWLQRADLMSRFLIVEFAKPPPSPLTERERIADVLAARDAIWAETLAALTLLGRDLPQHVPIGRFDDYERALAPIMAAAGYGQVFASALRKMPIATALLAARSDPFLGILLRLAQTPSVAEHWFTAAELADLLANAMGVDAGLDGHRASTLMRDPLRLAQYLAKVERQAGAVVTIEKRDARNHLKQWRITPRIPGTPFADVPRTGGDGGDDRGPL